MTCNNLDLSELLSKTSVFPERQGKYSDFYTGKCTMQGLVLPKLIGIKALRANCVYKELLAGGFTERFKKHAEGWAAFNHVNVARCYGYALDCGPMPAIIMDYYSEGNIMQYIKMKLPSFKEKIGMVLDIAEGLDYLHTLKPPVLHGDLRAANVFITDSKRAVIADYELGFIIPAQGSRGYGFEDNARWLASELLNDYEDTLTCTTASDVFAFAMTVIEIFAEEIPFAANTLDDVLRLRDKGQRPDLPIEILACTWFSELVQTCWAEEPTARPTSAGIIHVLSTRLLSI
ncbi:hypothetical protein APHAL10511_000298 [Amanita phalloides]|nr:hypothetical protein APHAL10511_000298 [Amanita phalloides]